MGQAVAQYLTLDTASDQDPNLTASQANSALDATFNLATNPVATNTTALDDLQNYTEANYYGLHALAYEGGPALGGSPLAGCEFQPLGRKCSRTACSQLCSDDSGRPEYLVH